MLCIFRPSWSAVEGRRSELVGLGSSLSSEPGGLTGLSVASHAGVLARSKISGSLLHRLSRPWTAWGQEAPTVINVQTIRRNPQIFFACGGRSILLFPGINIIFRHHGGARALSARYISRTKLVCRFWVKRIQNFSAQCGPDLGSSYA